MERYKIELANPNSTLLYDDAHWTRILHDPAYRDRLEKEAALLRAEAVRETAKVIGRGIRAAFRGLFRMVMMIAEGSAAVRLYEELSRLDDGQLADLGLRREQISQYVVDSMGGTPSRKKAVPADAALEAIDGGRQAPANTDEQPHRRAA